MRNLFGSALFVMALLFSLQQGLAQQVHTPARGTSERAAILDAVRPSLEAVLRPPVQFVVENMNVSQGWAFVTLLPQRPGGKKIDPLKTGLAKDWEHGFYDGLATYALLWFRNGRWNLVTSVIGPTDVAWEDWSYRYGAPKGIFGFPQ